MDEHQIYRIHCSYIAHEQYRLDKYISNIVHNLPFQISRSQLEKMIQVMRINGKEVKRSHKIVHKDELYIELHAVMAHDDNEQLDDKEQEAYEKQYHTLEILHEDEYLIAINKPRNMVVHPGAGHHHNTLSQIVFSKLSSYREEDEFNNRAGIVHRLDKDTSGVIIIAKTAKIHDKIARLFANREVKKVYIAVVHKEPRTRVGGIETYIGRHPHHRKKYQVVSNEHKGKFSSTDFRVLWTNKRYSVLLCMPHTGRTHQIRVHLQHIGCPIVGDTIYGRETTHYSNLQVTTEESAVCPLMLHAREINITLNIRGELIDYHMSAPIPHDMQQVFNAFDFQFNEKI